MDERALHRDSYRVEPETVAFTLALRKAVNHAVIDNQGPVPEIGQHSTPHYILVEWQQKAWSM